MSEIKTWIDKKGRQWAMYTGKFDANKALDKIRKFLGEKK